MGTTNRIVNTLASPARPVSVTEFVTALSRIWRPSESYSGNQSATWGLAISGGVDSMALAALCSQMHSSFSNTTNSLKLENNVSTLDFLPRVNFRAFVVDHGVRTGSAAEAQAVAKVLEERGLKTSILKIKWPTSANPSERPNFESLARKYRYQILGRACRDHGINSLFIAHHEDDQAETVVMRLINGHKRLGLAGMKSDSVIPECYGIHGVHESGGMPQERWRGRKAPSQPKLDKTLPRVEHIPQPVPETGGIRVYRPFLGFRKERLIATCQAEAVEWFEDHTNLDPTLTSRNAIRQLYKSNTMPAALTKPALLELTERFQELANTQLEMTKWCLSHCSIKRFDTRSGVLNVQFNDMNDSAIPPLTDKKLVAASVLRRIIMLVTPKERVRTPLLHTTLKRVFPELCPDEELDSGSFTVAGTQFKRLTNDAKCEWFISRQPHKKSTAMPLITFPPAAKEPSWSEWTLYDGRYWIRIQNHCKMPLSIRPYDQLDHKMFRKSLPWKMRTALHEMLKDIAPVDLRYTLPAICRPGDDGKEIVLGLPTLNVAPPKNEKLVKWE
ncbi:putative tRNA(Ile)-lysidine synthase [Lachnellula occidentalis]|uniref:tRNA(Ile)-lysidine synthetase n=1 Tax=Lachnellula occidentalis TaxID=215460 RepID=A0A8H8S5L0_9HELO|nr:putative tRNA(Ile)-lysidine synthase [Lachnellula occidentalis]